MKTKLFLLSLLAMFTIALSAQDQPARVQARNTPATILQPNGDSLTIRLIGDEHQHCYITVDGWKIIQNRRGFYCYALPGNSPVAGLRPSLRKAHDADKRRNCEKRWLRKHGINMY